MKTTKILLLLGFLFVCSPRLISQFSTGLILDEEELEKIPVLPDFGEGSKSESELLKGIKKIDLKPYCPKAQSQGATSSCVGWAVGYGAFTIQNAVANSWKGQTDKITENAFSALFIYNQIKPRDCNYGSRVSDALRLLTITGDLHYNEFEGKGVECGWLPNEQQIMAAGTSRIKDYMRLFRSSDNEREKVTKVKLSLLNNQPAIITMELRNNFFYLREDTDLWMPDLGDTTFANYHAMVVVGFDDGKEAFQVMNSWGSNWGNQGFFWIKYKDFYKYCKYAFNMVTETEANKATRLTGSFKFRYPDHVDQYGQVKFQQVPVFLREGIYQSHSVWPVNSRFQLEVENLNIGSYLYVFSIHTNGQTQIYWPKYEQRTNDSFGSLESSFIPPRVFKLVVPGAFKTMMFREPGTYYLCALVSDQPIQNFEEQLKDLAKNNQLSIAHLEKTFSLNILPQKQIHYATSVMYFQAKIKDGSIVPLLLKLNIGNNYFGN